jgi:hypothetical protein
MYFHHITNDLINELLNALLLQIIAHIRQFRPLKRIQLNHSGYHFL